MNTLNTKFTEFSADEVRGLAKDYELGWGIDSGFGWILCPSKNESQMPQENIISDLDKRGYTVTFLQEDPLDRGRRPFLLGKKSVRNLQESEVKLLQEVGKKYGLSVGCDASSNDYWYVGSKNKSYVLDDLYQIIQLNGFCPVVRQTITDGVRKDRKVIVKMLEERR